MRYVDAFVLPVPKKNLAEYRRLAVLGARIWRKHGALEYRECVGDELKPGFGLPFPKGIRSRSGETIVFSWIMYKSKAHRARVFAKVMKDPAMAKMMPKKMPFDVKRMLAGGFKVLVDG